MPVSLTRTVGFHAWHRYHAAASHDHHYRCAVTVTGPIDPESGGVVDLGGLDRLLEEEVVKPLEGRHIDRDVPHFAPGRALPTCEALASWLYERIALRLPRGVRLERVRVAEDESLHADCTGPT
jgi:6-pyruvoyltetrahydropterin/6-carboxytetrahydropterin synthase